MYLHSFFNVTFLALKSSFNDQLFQIGRRRGHKIQCFIDENGCYTRQMGYALENKNVLGDGEQAVLRLLKNDIIFKHSYQHSYPYDWRTKEVYLKNFFRQNKFHSGKIL